MTKVLLVIGVLALLSYVLESVIVKGMYLALDWAARSIVRLIGFAQGVAAIAREVRTEIVKCGLKSPATSVRTLAQEVKERIVVSINPEAHVVSLSAAIGLVIIAFLVSHVVDLPSAFLAVQIGVIGALIGWSIQAYYRSLFSIRAFKLDSIHFGFSAGANVGSSWLMTLVFFLIVTSAFLVCKHVEFTALGILFGAVTNTLTQQSRQNKIELSRNTFWGHYYPDISRWRKQRDTRRLSEQEKTIRSLLDKGNARAALRQLGSKSLAESVPKTEQYVLRSRALFILKDYKKVCEIVQAAFHENITSSRLTYLWTRALYNQGDLNVAFGILKKAIDNAEGANPYLWVNYGLCWSGIGDFDKAIECEERAAEIDDKCPLAKLLKALFLALSSKNLFGLTREHYGNNRERLLEALSLVSDSSIILRKMFLGKHIPQFMYLTEYNMLCDIKGYIHYKLGDLTAAGEMFANCIRRDRKYAWPYFHIALIFIKLGDRLTAISYLNHVLLVERKTPKSVLHRQAEKKLGKLVLHVKERDL